MDDELGYNNFKFIKEEVLNPLKLNNTFESLKTVALDSVMSGYHLGYPSDLKEDDHGMLATAENVGSFIRHLNEGTLFKPGEQEIYSSLYKYQHDGWVPGYQSFSYYDKDLDAVIVSFYNTTDSELYLWNHAEIINNRITRIIEKSGATNWKQPNSFLIIQKNKTLWNKTEEKEIQKTTYQC